MHCEFNWNCDSKNLTPSGVTREIFPTWSPISETYCLLNDIYIYVYKSIPSFFAPESSLRFPCLGSLSEDFWWKFLPWEVEKSWRWSCPKMVLTFEGEKSFAFPRGGGCIYINVNHTPTEFPPPKPACGRGSYLNLPAFERRMWLGRNLLPKMFIVRKGLGSESLDPGMLL